MTGQAGTQASAPKTDRPTAQCCIDGHWTQGCPIKDVFFETVSSDKDWINNILLKDGQEEPEEQINLYEELMEKWHTSGSTFSSGHDVNDKQYNRL